MIAVDYNRGSIELLPLIQRFGVEAEKSSIPADFCFEGNGPHGQILIGVERKTLSDLLACIEDARLSGHQIIKMGQLCQISFVIVEGKWKPDDQGSGVLYVQKDGDKWFPYREKSATVMYAKIRRYLFSLSLAGVQVIYSRDMVHTAYDVCELYWYFQKKWKDHTSLLEVQKVALPRLWGKPSLVRKWASDLEGIGTNLSQDAEKLFKKPITLACADEEEWLRLPGVGVKTAQSIIKEIWGTK